MSKLKVLKGFSISSRGIGMALAALMLQLAVSPAWSEGVVSQEKPAVTKTKPRLSGPVECIRTGQRTVAALARDDSGAATHFHAFYEAFNCPASQLAKAFGCLVNLQEKNPSISNPSPDQVEQCWANPSKTPEVAPPAETPKEGDTKPKG
jgi:hypothetical protein